ncbi:MAG: gamma-glutamyltransferase [Myxococcales bacterium]|nr:gamma-glutamyltransferase [Myxococcales bacterium]
MATAAAQASDRATVTAAAQASDQATAAAAATAPPPVLAMGGVHAVRGARGMVASEDAHATRIGAAVLENGGNAIDAAVAVGFALSVTHHSAGSLGGGGFMLVRLATGESVAIDYRETAPAKATEAFNKKQLARGAHGYASAPVPGVVAGLVLARDRFGSLPLAELVRPSIELADKGHALPAREALVLSWYWKRLAKDAQLAALLGRRGAPLSAGMKLRQPALAETLRAIAARGKAGFYEGAVAEKVAHAMQKNGGLVTLADLAGYQAKLREPLKFHYRGLEIHTMPPPSMGGVALASIMLNLEAARAFEAPPGSALARHLFIESSRRAYADRRTVGADPEFADAKEVQPLLASLLDVGFHARRQPPILRDRATPSSAVTPLRASVATTESTETTHFSVVDAQGNAVSCTTTLSAAFGAWVLIAGTGIIPSNAMGAFSPSGINAVTPQKRMASSMTPTLVVREGHTVAMLGSPGGDTIPNTVAQVLRNLVDEGMTIDRAVEEGRIHHQYKPDQVRFEQKRPPAPALQAQLARLGHKLTKNPMDIGAANCIVFDPKSRTAWGFADTRKHGLALGP